MKRLEVYTGALERMHWEHLEVLEYGTPGAFRGPESLVSTIGRQTTPSPKPKFLRAYESFAQGPSARFANLSLVF